MCVDILSLNKCEVNKYFKELNLPTFRANQVYSWLHNKQALDYDLMTNIPKDLREILKIKFPINTLKIENCFISKIDETRKYLFSLNDGDYIESVVMKYKYGYTICVSSQVGCKMGCKFCASTLGGFKRNLTAGEILSQIYLAQKDLNTRISHIVMMGMGEPLDNYDNVTKFIELVTDSEGLNISMRNISLSTCGLVPNINRLLDNKYQLTLSISLHAPCDEIRDTIMPVNHTYNVEQLINICKKYTDITKRRISFEYSMIKNLNDTDKCANQLGSLLKGMLCHVNLIPINEVKESQFKPSDSGTIKHFISILEKYGITATVRRTLGSDINASCGQLRRKKNLEELEEKI